MVCVRKSSTYVIIVLGDDSIREKEAAARLFPNNKKIVSCSKWGLCGEWEMVPSEWEVFQTQSLWLLAKLHLLEEAEWWQMEMWSYKWVKVTFCPSHFFK